VTSFARSICNPYSLLFTWSNYCSVYLLGSGHHYLTKFTLYFFHDSQLPTSKTGL
ncbi:19754_t:CDS:1, partial [Gigaspora rosea]